MLHLFVKIVVMRPPKKPRPARAPFAGPNSYYGPITPPMIWVPAPFLPPPNPHLVLVPHCRPPTTPHQMPPLLATPPSHTCPPFPAVNLPPLPVNLQPPFPHAMPVLNFQPHLPHVMALHNDINAQHPPPLRPPSLPQYPIRHTSIEHLPHVAPPTTSSTPLSMLCAGVAHAHAPSLMPKENRHRFQCRRRSSGSSQEAIFKTRHDATNGTCFEETRNASNVQLNTKERVSVGSSPISQSLEKVEAEGEAVSSSPRDIEKGEEGEQEEEDIEEGEITESTFVEEKGEATSSSTNDSKKEDTQVKEVDIPEAAPMDLDNLLNTESPSWWPSPSHVEVLSTRTWWQKAIMLAHDLYGVQ